MDNGFVFVVKDPLFVATVVPIIDSKVSDILIYRVIVSSELNPDPHISISSWIVNTVLFIVIIVAWGWGASCPVGPVVPIGPGGPLTPWIPCDPGSPFSPWYPISPCLPIGPFGPICPLGPTSPSIVHDIVKEKSNTKNIIV